MERKRKFIDALPRTTAHWLLMLPLLLLAVWLAAPGLNADMIWYDELTAISHAGGLDGSFSPLDVLDSVRERSPKHTPLFFELAAGWAALVGWHHAVLRCLPLFFGVLALAWTYRLGADFMSRRAGFLAAAFLGLNVFWLDYLHEVRMYSLQFALIMALAWHYFLLASGGRARRIHWAGLTMHAALCLYAQPFTIFFHIALGIYHLLFVKPSRRWMAIALAMLAAGLLYLPWLPVTLTGLSTKFDTAFDAISLQQALSVFVRLLSNGSPLILAVALLAALYAVRNDRRLLTFWFMALAVLAVLLGANEAVGLIPLRRSRYFFVAWGMWALVIGSGLACLRWRWLPLVILAAYLAAGFAFREAEDYLQHQGTVGIVHAYPPMDEYVARLSGKVKTQDYLLGFTATEFVNWPGKRGKSTADYYLETLLGIDGAFVKRSLRGEDLALDLAGKLDEHPYLLFTYDPAQRPANLNEVETLLLQDYQPCQIVMDAPDLRVQRFVRRPVGCQRAYQPIYYDNGITIVDKFAIHDRERGVISLVTGWQVPDRAMLDAFNVSIQIITSDWRNMHQAPDRHLYDDVLKWYVADLPTADLPPGDYRVVVIVYDRYHSSSKLNGLDATTGQTGGILPLYHFTIAEDAPEQ